MVKEFLKAFAAWLDDPMTQAVAGTIIASAVLDLVISAHRRIDAVEDDLAAVRARARLRTVAGNG